MATPATRPPAQPAVMELLRQIVNGTPSSVWAKGKSNTRIVIISALDMVLASGVDVGAILASMEAASAADDNTVAANISEETGAGDTAVTATTSKSTSSSTPDVEGFTEVVKKKRVCRTRFKGVDCDMTGCEFEHPECCEPCWILKKRDPECRVKLWHVQEKKLVNKPTFKRKPAPGNDQRGKGLPPSNPKAHKSNYRDSNLNLKHKLEVAELKLKLSRADRPGRAAAPRMRTYAAVVAPQVAPAPRPASLLPADSSPGVPMPAPASPNIVQALTQLMQQQMQQQNQMSQQFATLLASLGLPA